MVELLAQHAELRVLVDNCGKLIERLETGAPVAGTLALAVMKLRLAFDAHSRFEERHLRPLLENDAAVDAHVQEHRGLHRTLDDTTIDSLRATLDALEHHLDEEERYFVRTLTDRAKAASRTNQVRGSGGR